MNGANRGIVWWVCMVAMALASGCAATTTGDSAQVTRSWRHAEGGAAEIIAGKAGEHTAEGLAPDTSLSARACLKEGEPCNTLNDQCCSGYYCFGGLVPTCVRKP